MTLLILEKLKESLLDLPTGRPPGPGGRAGGGVGVDCPAETSVDYRDIRFEVSDGVARPRGRSGPGIFTASGTADRFGPGGDRDGPEAMEGVMQQLVRSGPVREPAHSSRRARRPVLVWMALLVLPALPALRPAASAGETEEASARSGDVVRAGCIMHVGDPDSRGIAEVSADCRWPVAPEHVVEIMRDQDGIDDVLSSVLESRVLPDGRVVQVHSMGRMAANRQVTLRFRWRELEGGGVRIDFGLSPEQQGLGEGRVQIAVDEGWWEIRSDGAGGTRLRYAVRYDAGGSIKPWLARRFQKTGIVRSLAEMRLAAERASELAVSTGPEEPAGSAEAGSVSAPPAPGVPGGLPGKPGM